MTGTQPYQPSCWLLLERPAANRSLGPVLAMSTYPWFAMIRRYTRGHQTAELAISESSTLRNGASG